MEDAEFVAPDIHCEKCAGRVRAALQQIPGVQRVDVDVKTTTVRVGFDENETSRPQIADAMAQAGYAPQMQ
jgi:copper chaperone CopZ